MWKKAIYYALYNIYCAKLNLTVADYKNFDKLSFVQNFYLILACVMCTPNVSEFYVPGNVALEITCVQASRLLSEGLPPSDKMM